MESALGVAVIVLAGVTGGMALGFLLGAVLPTHHLSDASRDPVKATLGLLTTLTALVLGLLIASAKTSYDAKSDAIIVVAGDIVMLDRTLSRYGPEASEIRRLVRESTAAAIKTIWIEDKVQAARVGGLDNSRALEIVQDRVRALSPTSDGQRQLQAQAAELTRDIARTLWLTSARVGVTIPVPFLAVLVAWLAIIFTALTLFAPRNGMVMVTMFVCALSVSAAIFLILELDTPYRGLIRLSSAPLHRALEHLGE